MGAVCGDSVRTSELEPVARAREFGHEGSRGSVKLEYCGIAGDPDIGAIRSDRPSGGVTDRASPAKNIGTVQAGGAGGRAVAAPVVPLGLDPRA